MLEDKELWTFPPNVQDTTGSLILQRCGPHKKVSHISDPPSFWFLSLGSLFLITFPSSTTPGRPWLQPCLHFPSGRKLSRQPLSQSNIFEVHHPSKICFVYIDNIIIYSPSVAQHFWDLQTVIHRLETAGLTISLKKCKSCLSEITFLGHVVSITTNPSKVEAIHAFPAPSNLKEVLWFLGLAGWYHWFVSNFSKIASPSIHWRKRDRCFNGRCCQKAFDQLKACLTSPPFSATINYTATENSVC